MMNINDLCMIIRMAVYIVMFIDQYFLLFKNATGFVKANLKHFKIDR